jgi:serine/threonine protein kinase
MRPDDLHPGDLIAGKYRVRAILARQPSLLVEAFHTEFDQRVIVKVLPAWAADAKEVERFRREARVLAKLESEHVARILDVGSEKDGSFYLVRQHLEGTDLAEHVQKVGALQLDEAVGIVMQLAEAVAETHVHGIVIRELSPAHVHLARRVGGGHIAKVSDFGTAKLLRDNAAPAGNSSLTATAMFGLSPYSSPEMVRKAKNVDGRTDVWSLGAILYHLLTGQPPFQGDIATLMLAITRDDPTPPSMLRRGLPQEIDQIIAWALAKDVDRRFRDVNALAHALAPYGTSESQVLAERITALHAAARGHKDGPGSRPASPRAQAPRSAPPPRPGASTPPPPGSMRPPAMPTGMGASSGPRTQPPPPMPAGAAGGGLVAAMRSRLPSGLDDLPAGEDDATVVLGAMEQQTGRKPNTIPPPPPSMPPTPWQPGAERARSPRLVPPAALSQPPPSMASQMGNVSTAMGGMANSSLGGTLGASHGPGSSQSLSRDAVAAQASSLSPATHALQRASKTQGGRDRRVLVGAMASMAVLLPVILVLLLSKSAGPTPAELGAAPIPVATERVLPPTPDPVPPPTSAPIVASPEPTTAPAPTPSATGSQVVAIAEPPTPPTPPNNPGARTPPPRQPPAREPPAREPPPKKEPPKKEEPKKEEPKSSGGGSNGNLLAIASGGSCTFIVNGSPKGSGSSVKVALSPGNYSVTCKPSSGASKSRSVSIKSGETSMLTFKL